jgi:hypothetical protein
MIQYSERNFTMTDAELTMKVSQVVDWMERDEAEFIIRGVSAADRQAMETAGNDFEEFLPDDYYRGRITSAVTIKNEIKDDLEELVQNVSGYTQQKFGIHSGEYTSLKVKGYVAKTEDAMLKSARTVAKVSEILLPDLSPIGLTQGEIDGLRAKAQEFEDALDTIAIREGERTTEAQKRVLEANSLYSMLSKNCEIGKLIWENTNPTYYDNYIIYKTVHSGLSKVQNLTATPVASNAYDLTWDLVVDADYYEVEYAEATAGQPQGPWLVYQSTPNPPIGFQANEGFSFWLRVRARDNQGKTGSWSNTLVL